MVKEDVVYTQNGILASYKKDILPFVTMWVDLEDLMLSEVSQMEIDKYCMISLIDGIWNTNKQTKTKQMNKLNPQILFVQRTEQWLWEGKAGGETGKRDQPYADRQKLNFWLEATCRVYRNRNIMLYTGNLYSFINQRHLNKNK